MKNIPIVSTAVSLFCGLLIVAGGRNASPAQQPDALAQQAFELLDRRCGQCHGETGSNKDLMLISRTGRDALVGKRSEGEKQLLVDTDKPEASLLYLRITGRHPSGVMPPAYASNPAPLTAAEQASLLKWIQSGAPDWKNVQKVRPQRRFIFNADILHNIARDLATLDVDRQKDMRYFTLTHLYNAGVSDTEIAAYRDGLKRLINSLSWEGQIIVPQAIDPEQTIFRINLTQYGWTAATWKTILKAYPYNIHFTNAGFTEICTTTGCELPFIRADWFVTHAALPPLYHDILELPSGKDADVKLEKKLLDARGTRDANQDIDQAPGERVWRSGFRKSGVSANNRVVEWHTSLYGYYWKSYDFADVTGFQNIKQHPLDFQRAGGEIIFGLPNGLQGYMLVNKEGVRLDIAPPNIVSNDRATTKDKQIYNGLSCMGCHTQGMIDGFEIEEVRNALVKFPDGETRRQGLKIYADRAQMQQLLDDSKKRYRDALAKLNSVAGTNEPIVALAEKFQSDVDAELAAAELGLSTVDFQKIVTTLNDPVLNDFKSGKIARKSWEEQLNLVVGKMAGATYIVAQAAINPQQAAVPTRAADSHLPGGSKSERKVSISGLFPHLDADYGMELVEIQAGEFTMGSAEKEREALPGEWYVGEFPQHKVYLDTYYIMKTPVTVKQYLAFCAATGRAMPAAPNFNPNWSQQNHPMVNVTWSDAIDYCAWLSNATRCQVSLPTEAQWEKAARGEDCRTFPWGNRFDSRCLQCSQQTFGDIGGTAMVGSFPLGASPYGVLDMAGNVWQWCSDWYDGSYYANSPMRNPTGPASGQYHVLRGGSWNNFNAPIFRSANRGRATSANRAYWNGGIGFRCVVVPR